MSKSIGDLTEEIANLATGGLAVDGSDSMIETATHDILHWTIGLHTLNEKHFIQVQLAVTNEALRRAKKRTRK